MPTIESEADALKGISRSPSCTGEQEALAALCNCLTLEASLSTFLDWPLGIRACHGQIGDSNGRRTDEQLLLELGMVSARHGGEFWLQDLYEIS